MPSTDCATEDLPLETALRTSGGTSKPLKGLFFGFAATVTVGLALGTWYVGVRIVAADEVRPSSTSNTVPVSVTTAPPAAAPQAVTADSMAEAYWYNVPPAVFFLQVAGLGPKQDARFVRSLQGRGFHAQAQARDDGNSRILIGPFSTRAEMELAQRKLQGAGVLADETAH